MTDTSKLKMQFENLCKLEPGLESLLEYVRTLPPEKMERWSTWYSLEFKPCLCSLVGYGAKVEALQTMDAYNTALEYLLRNTPEEMEEAE